MLHVFKNQPTASQAKHIDVLQDHDPELAKDSLLPPLFRRNDHFKYIASAQPNPSQFDAALRQILTSNANAKFTIIDCRAEPHCFVDNLSIQPVDNATHDVFFTKLQDCQELLISLLDDGSFFAKREYTQAQIKFEPDVVATSGSTYINLGIVNHDVPRPEAIDNIMQAIQQRTEDAWFYVHCAGGKGRTSVIAAVLVLYQLYLQDKIIEGLDLETTLRPHLDPKSWSRLTKHLQSASTNSLQNLALQRSLSILSMSSLDENQTLPRASISWQSNLSFGSIGTDLEEIQKRYIFVEKYFAYLKCLVARKDFMSWSEWVAKQQVKSPQLLDYSLQFA